MTKQKPISFSLCPDNIAYIADKWQAKHRNRSHWLDDLVTHLRLKDESAKPKVEIVGLDDAFDIFYSAGLPKKSKAAALKKFKSLVKEMKADPFEFANLLVMDIQSRITNNQMGIDALHPSTYLNQQRWTDENDNNGRVAPNGKQSAAERIAARNNAKYGQPSSGLGMAEGSGDLRGTMDQGERRNTISYVEPSIEQARSIDCEEWNQTDY